MLGRNFPVDEGIATGRVVTGDVAKMVHREVGGFRPFRRQEAALWIPGLLTSGLRCCHERLGRLTSS